MIAYHFTDAKLWPVISVEGLQPYPLKTQLRQTLAQIGMPPHENGILLWPEVDDKLLIDFFLQKSVVLGVERGLLLRCDIGGLELANKAGDLDVYLSHRLRIDDVLRHDKPMLLCLERIVPGRFSVTKEICITITEA